MKSYKSLKSQVSSLWVYLYGLAPLSLLLRRQTLGTYDRKDYTYTDALKSLLQPIGLTHSEAQGVLMLALLPKIDELNAMLNGSKVYSFLDCTSGYHLITLSLEAQNKSKFVTYFSKLVPLTWFKFISFSAVDKYSTQRTTFYFWLFGSYTCF